MMTNIDLLPDWYTSGKRTQKDMRSLYVLLVVVIGALVVWNISTGYCLSSAQATLGNGLERYIDSQNVMSEVQQIESQVGELKKKSELINSIDSKVDISSVIAELSYLIDSKVVCGEVFFESEKFSETLNVNSTQSGIRIAGTANDKETQSHLGKVRFKCKLRGIAAETSDVGKLMRKLEESDYFHLVSLSFSRNKQIRISAADGDKQKDVSEFEITCYLANYLIVDGSCS